MYFPSREAIDQSHIPPPMRVHSSPGSSSVAEALQEYGFCLVQGHMNQDRQEGRLNVLANRRFALSSATKQRMSSSSSSSSSMGNRSRCVVPEEGFGSSTPDKEAFHFHAARHSEESLEWGIGKHLKSMTEFGDQAFRGVNEQVLRCHAYWQSHHHRRGEAAPPPPPSSHAFPHDAACVAWNNAMAVSKQHVLSFFKYRGTNPREFHVEDHVDKGVLTICENPKDLEVLYNGQWYDLGSYVRPPLWADAFVIMVGYSLERATGGIFQAVRHRVRNTGPRRARVTKLRFDPHLVIYPPAVVAKAPAHLQDYLPLEMTPSIVANDMLLQFNASHASVNAAPVPVQPIPTLHNDPNAEWMASHEQTPHRDHEAAIDSDNDSSLSLTTLPTDLLHSILDWNRDLRDSVNVAGTCRLLRNIVATEEHLIPAAETAPLISFDRVLDKMGGRSCVRLPDHDKFIPVLQQLALELKSKFSTKITIRVKGMDGKHSLLKLKRSTRMAKLKRTYAQNKGASLSSITLLNAGTRVLDHQTPYSMGIHDQGILHYTARMLGD